MDFVAWCQAVLDNDIVRQVAEARAKSGDTKVLEFVAKYSQSQPAQQHKLDATLTLKATRE